MLMNVFLLQETDFLGAVYHLYDSDTESDTGKVPEKISSSKLERQKYVHLNHFKAPFRHDVVPT